MNAHLVDRCKVPQNFWRAFEILGLRPAVILRQARLPATLHLNGPVFVSTAKLFAIWNAVEQLTSDPDVSLKFVKAMDVAGHQPAFLAATYAADFRNAISRLNRFKSLGTCEKFHFEERSDVFSIHKEWPYAVEPEPDISIDVTFAYLIELGRRGTGQHLTPVRVDFARPSPKSDFNTAYFGCPIRYEAPRNMLVLKSADLDRPFPGHNSEFLDLLTPALAAAVSDIELQSNFTDQVRLALRKSLPSGRTDIANLAREMGMSERTLQRRITEEGTTFRSLLLQARLELGRQLLSNPMVDVQEVACMLGYQDTSSFYRAFRDWEGVTPNRWRMLNAGNAAGGLKLTA